MKRGIATLELLIALGVLTLMLAGIVVISFGSQSIALDTSVATNALFVTRSALSEVRNEVMQGGTYGATTTDGIFTVETRTWPITECLTRIEARTSWWEDRLRPQETILSGVALHENILNALRGDCDSRELALDDWETSTIVGEEDLSAGVQDLDIVRRDDRMYAFVVSQNTSTTTPDLTVVDVTNTAEPVTVSTFDLDPYIFPMTAIDVAGDYAYIGSSEEGAQFVVVDVSSPDTPGCVVTSALPEVSGSYPGAISVAYYDSRVYVGTRETLGPELHIFDVDTPFLCDEGVLHEGSLELGHSVYALVVREDYAYVAASASSVEYGCELIVIDVSNPLDMHNPCPWGGPVGSTVFQAPGEFDGTSLSVGFGQVLLGGRRMHSTGNFYVLNTQNLNNITEIGRGNLNLPSQSDYVSGIASRGEVMVASTNGGEGIQFWNIAGPGVPQDIGAVDTDGDIVAMEVFENVVYALRGGSDPALLMITP